VTEKPEYSESNSDNYTKK